MNPPLSIRLRINGYWVICRPVDDDVTNTSWVIEVMDVRSQKPTNLQTEIDARIKLNRVLSDLRHQTWDEIQRLKAQQGNPE